MTQLTVHQCEVCRRAVDHFGRRAQLLKVAEELRELADECEAAANGGSSMDALALERADVEVMLYQLDELLLPTLAAHVPAKIAAQIDRLERRIDAKEAACQALQPRKSPPTLRTRKGA